MFGLSDSVLEQLSCALEREELVVEARVFGSRALGNYKSGSDIDIALFGTGLTEEVRTRLLAYLNERTLIPHGIDIVIYTEKLPMELKEHIENFGKPLYRRTVHKGK